MSLAQHSVSGCLATESCTAPQHKAPQQTPLPAYPFQSRDLLNNSEDRHSEPTHAHSLAVSAVERAQLRHKRRIQRRIGRGMEQHTQVTDTLAIHDVWTDFPVAASSVGALLQQSSTQARLDRMQELRLAKVMAEGRHLVMMLDPTQQHNQQLHLHMAAQPVSPCMAVQEAHAARVAKRQLAQAHLWLVFKVVSAYQRQKLVCTDDLVQAGLHGLDTALDKFDPGRGNRLSTVAYMWIKDAVGRAYNQLVGTIKVSERTRRNVRKVLAAQGQLPPHQGSSLESLQHLTGLSRRTVANALQACRITELSLEAATTSSTAAGQAQVTTPLVDQLSSFDMLEHQHDLHDPLAGTLVAEMLMEGALQQLPHAEATVLHHVYGLQDGLPKSRPQVARLMGTGLHHVRKLEQKAMAFLRTLNMADSLHAAESGN